VSVIWFNGSSRGSRRHNRLVDVGRESGRACLSAQPWGHILLRFVNLRVARANGLLDGADNDGGINALFLAQELDTLIQNAGHTLVALSASLALAPVQ